jgi:hypothetical protein
MKFIDLSDIVFRRSREVGKSTKYLPVARKEGLLGHRGELLRSNHVGLDHRQSRPGLVLTLKEVDRVIVDWLIFCKVRR